MDKIVSAAEANRKFSQLLRGVQEGRSFTVTSRGRPVARLIPIEQPDAAMLRARRSLLAELRIRKAVNIGKWTREELYDE